jgi:hypothetical protein
MFFENAEKKIINFYNLPYILSSPRLHSTMMVKNETTKKNQKVIAMNDDEVRFMVGPKDYPNYKSLAILSCNQKKNHMWTQESTRKIEKHGKYVSLGIEFLIK